MSLKISILDQSPISEGMSAEKALENTVKLARKAEQLGYHRFWVSEHHDSTSLAGSSPEVLLGYLAANTSSIRLGSGGVMLTHYSPYKVAENFQVLSALAPGRIDVGVGRAPGGMPRATIALNNSRDRKLEQYPEKVKMLLHYLHDDLEEDHQLFGLKAAPIVHTPPDLWMLGSSESSAKLAAQMGVPYAFAHFINADGGTAHMNTYIENFKPSTYYKKSKNLVTVHAICAETDEEAEIITSSLDLFMLQSAQGMKQTGVPSPKKALSYEYSTFEKKHIVENRKRMLVGSPKRVVEGLLRLSETYQTNEIMIVTITYDFQAKLRSYELIAKELLG